MEIKPKANINNLANSLKLSKFEQKSFVADYTALDELEELLESLSDNSV